MQVPIQFSNFREEHARRNNGIAENGIYSFLESKGIITDWCSSCLSYRWMEIRCQGQLVVPADRLLRLHQPASSIVHRWRFLDNVNFLRSRISQLYSSYCCIDQRHRYQLRKASHELPFFVTPYFGIDDEPKDDETDRSGQ